MKNLADAIESFIIGELLREHEDTVLVQRWLSACPALLRR